MTDSFEFDPVLAFWFGALESNGLADDAHASRWWKKDPAFDERIRREFGAIHAAVASGAREAWLTTPKGRLATIIVLDQFSRNMFRGSPNAFATDEHALRVAREGLARGVDRELALEERVFFYMPLMHAEDPATQDDAVALFQALCDEHTGPTRDRLTTNWKFAVQHRDIVARFGRFPHRNSALGRASSSEEIEFLKQPGSSF